MEEVKNEQTISLSQPAEAEIDMGEQKESVSLGKFKDVNSLLNAYNSLQSEFTKRCQRIKELESTTNKAKPLVEEASSQSTSGATQLDKEDVLKEYLIDLERRKSNAIVINGEGVGMKTPYNKPKTIAEASKLARELLNKKN
jgi:hypothetical protein